MATDLDWLKSLVQLMNQNDLAELSLEEEDGTPVDTVRRGGIYRFRGQVLDRPGGAPVPFTARLDITLKDLAGFAPILALVRREMPVKRCAAIAAPPSQAGQPETSRVMTAQYHGQKPLGLSSEVAAKNERPVFMLYLMHS